MRRRLLRLIANRCFRFSGLAALILILLTLMSIAGIRRIRLDAGLEGTFAAAGSDFASIHIEFTASNETTDEELSEIVSDVAARLFESPMPASQDLFVEAQDEARSAITFDDADSLLLTLYPSESADDVLFSMKVTRFIEENIALSIDSLQGARDKFAYRIHGPHAELAQTMRSVAREAELVAMGSLALFMMLIVLVFRKGEAIVFVLLPPVMGLIWTLGLIHLYCQTFEINIVSRDGISLTRIGAVPFVFLSITFGIGLNYSLYLYHRFTIELYRSKNYFRALNTVYLETGRGLMTSGMTAAAIFFLLYFSSFPELQTMGIVAGTSMLCNLVVSLFVLPTLAALKSWIAKGDVHAIALSRLSLLGISERAMRMPRATIGAFLVVAIFLGVAVGESGIETPRFEFDQRFLFAPSDSEVFASEGGSEQALRIDLAWLILLGGPIIFIGLGIHFKRLRFSLIASLNTLMQVVIILGALKLAGIKVHILSLLPIPLVVTLAVDNSVQLIQHYLDRGLSDVRLSVVTLSRSNLLTCGSIGMLYGMMALISVDGLKDLGLVVMIGCIVTFMATAALLPALLKVWGHDQSILSILNLPEDGPK